MIQVVDQKNVLKVLEDYFGTLSLTGYVRHDNIPRLLVYLFLADFVEFTYDFLTKEDYETLSKVLRRQFVNGGCLFPYPLFCVNRATLGKSHYIGNVRLRTTEGRVYTTRIKRVTEDNDLRVEE